MSNTTCISASGFTGRIREYLFLPLRKRLPMLACLSSEVMIASRSLIGFPEKYCAVSKPFRDAWNKRLSRTRSARDRVGRMMQEDNGARARRAGIISGAGARSDFSRLTQVKVASSRRGHHPLMTGHILVLLAVCLALSTCTDLGACPGYGPCTGKVATGPYDESDFYVDSQGWPLPGWAIMKYGLPGGQGQ